MSARRPWWWALLPQLIVTTALIATAVVVWRWRLELARECKASGGVYAATLTGYECFQGRLEP